MSSFAQANLVLIPHQGIVISNMVPGSYLIQLNETWLAYLPCRSRDGVAAISMQAPVLCFNHPEDHGWDFAVIENGETTSSLSIDYEFRANLPFILWQREHPMRGDYMDFYADPGHESFEHRAQAEYEQHVADLFAAIDFSRFALFGVDSDGIQLLRDALTPQAFAAQPFDMVRTFTRVLHCGIDFVSWEKVDEYGDDHFQVVARA